MENSTAIKTGHEHLAFHLKKKKKKKKKSNMALRTAIVKDKLKAGLCR